MSFSINKQKKQSLELPIVRRQAKSYTTLANLQISTKLTPKPIRKSSLNTHDTIKQKASSYMMSKPTQSKIELKIIKKTNEGRSGNKIFEGPKDFPQFRTIDQFLAKQREIVHIYKQKMQIGFDQCFLFYMNLLSIAVNNDYIVSHDYVDKQRSFIIDFLQFLCENLIETSLQKVAFFFCVKAVNLCQIYKEYLKMGKFLFLMGKIARKMSRFEHSIIYLKKGLEYLWRERTPVAEDIEIQIYDQLSQCYLQMNMVDQSKTFGQKYEIGYIEKQNSKIIQLSRQLVTSVQNRKKHWHAATRQSMELLFSFDVDYLIKTHKNSFMGRPDQRKLLEILKINFQYLYEAFLQDDMFFYEIPTPLEIQQSQENKVILRKRPSMGLKFISKKSRSVSQLAKKQPQVIKQFESVKESIIFNFRGVKVCKNKLSTSLSRLINKIKQKSQVKKQNIGYSQIFMEGSELNPLK